MLLLLAGPMTVKGRHLYQPHLLLPRKEYVISKFCSFFTLVIYWAFLQLTLYTCFFSSIGSLSTRRILQPLALYCLMSPNLRYAPFLFFICACILIHCYCHMLSYTVFHFFSFFFFFFFCMFVYILFCFNTISLS